MYSYPWPSSLLIVTTFLILWQSPLLVGQENITTTPPGMSFSPSIALPKGMTTIPKFMKYFKTKESGPGNKENYNPHAGYEPYWHDGDWVFNNSKVQKSNESMCERDCDPMYQQYGQICGYDLTKKGSGVFFPKYKTFKNYCAMVSEDCEGKYGWSIVYRGECSTEEPKVPVIQITDINDRKKYTDRVASWHTYWESRNLTTISGRKLKALQKWLHDEKKKADAKARAELKAKAKASNSTTSPSFRRKGHNKYLPIKYGLDQQRHVL